MFFEMLIFYTNGQIIAMNDLFLIMKKKPDQGANDSDMAFPACFTWPEKKSTAFGMPFPEQQICLPGSPIS